MDEVEWFENVETCEHDWKQVEFTRNEQCVNCGIWGGK
jgi:hypothetical protein